MFGPQLAKFKVKKFDKEIEPQEVLLDSLAKKKEEAFGVSEKRLEVPLSRRMLQGFWLFFLITALVLFGKTFQLQILEGKAFSDLSERNKFAIRLIQAQRGVIYDRNLRQLVSNKPSFDLLCDKSELPRIAGIIQKDYLELDNAIIFENLDHQALVLFEVRSHDFPGCQVENNTAREYSDSLFFSHILGYQRKTGEKTGLESYYDQILQPKFGEIRVERDARGNPISSQVVSMPESGQSLVLWLDSDLQQKLAQSLERSIKNIGSKSGAAIVLDPKTGGVLAMVSLPGFDNNLFSQKISQLEWQNLQEDPRHPLFNRVISGRYPTGSAIKPLIASAVLQEKIVSPDKKINCLGQIVIANPWNPDILTIKKDWDVHGWSDIRKAIAESCNVYFYTVGGGYGDQAGLGPTKIKKYLELFGWGQTTGIDLPEETSGFLPDKEWKKKTLGENWWDGDTYNFAIGQGYLLITPIEVAAAFSVIANGGTLYQPQIIKQIADDKDFPSKIIRQNFIDPENLQIVREGMRQAVTGINAPHASSVFLNSLPFPVAAKTGTAELGDDLYHNWITVFAPYEDPQIVLTVMVENVKGTRQAAVLPVAREVLEWYFSPR